MPDILPIESYTLPTREDIPANVVDWTLDPHRAVLLVHDMQGYFVDAFPEPLRSCLVANAGLLRKRCASLGVPVAFTAQPGRMTEEERGLLKDFWGPGMRSEAADRDVVPELAPEPGDRRFVKWRYSAFHRSGLLEWLAGEGRDQLVLCGVYAHVGILATAIEAFTHDIQVFLAADAVGDFSAERHRLAMDYVAQRCGTLRLTEEVFR
ncbi:isochorismatase family protein [Streptomyces lusitanus]|uniref:Isochorismatase family protein n=1 Tax=Streptomyces lusitanus TaxID=68232 RepID=A0ABU3JV56_9ACTN|nr:isochorismatase family protein [Streptomyces lusitanus]